MIPYLLVSADLVKTGGMDRANYALASYLARRGHPVHVVAHQVAPKLLGRPNVRFHRVPKIAGSDFLSQPLLQWAGRYWAPRISDRGGRVLVNGGNCLFGDVNWVHYVHAAYQPRVATSLGYRVKSRMGHFYDSFAERASLTRARVVICNSWRTREDVIRLLGVPESRAHVIYYGTDADRFGPITQEERAAARKALGWGNTRPVVAFIGALGDRRKGFDTLFSSWEMLCKDPAWDCDLAVIGTGAELPAWEQRARVADLADRFKFLGFRKDVPSLLAACDALIHPARYEAYGLGVQEALSRGLPALVSMRAGVAERYPARLSALLIPDPENPAGLADRLRNWRQNLERLQEAVEPLSVELRGNTWDTMAAQIMNLVTSKG